MRMFLRFCLVDIGLLVVTPCGLVSEENTVSIFRAEFRMLGSEWLKWVGSTRPVGLTKESQGVRRGQKERSKEHEGQGQDRERENGAL
jgi:hypothetical protein